MYCEYNTRTAATDVYRTRDDRASGARPRLAGGREVTSMAETVLGIGTLHGPLLTTRPEEWGQRAEADRRNPALFYRGKPYTFPALVEARKAAGFEREITPERMAKRHAACQRAIDALADV